MSTAESGPPSWPALPLAVPSAAAVDTTADDTGLGLRQWRTSDAAVLATAWADPELRRWLDPPQGDVEAARTWIEGEEARRRAGLALDLVIDRGGIVVGEVGLWRFDARRRACMVGYWVLAEHRGRGDAAKALAAATWFFRDVLDGEAMLAECHQENTASCRTAEAAGFEVVGQHDGRLVYAWRRAGNIRPPAGEGRRAPC